MDISQAVELTARENGSSLSSNEIQTQVPPSTLEGKSKLKQTNNDVWDLATSFSDGLQLSESIRASAKYLTDRLETLYTGTIVSEARQSAKREAEEAVDKLSASRPRKAWLGASILDWFSHATFSLTETQAEKEERFRRFHERKAEEFAIEDASKFQVPPAAEPQREVLVEKSSAVAAKKSEAVIDLISDDESENNTPAVESSTSVDNEKKASQDRLEMRKKRIEELTNQHKSYLEKLRKEGRLKDGKGGDNQNEFSYLIRRKPITDEEEQTLDDAFGGGGGDSVEVCERFGWNITKHSFRTANLGCWLNDEILNCFLQLCCARGCDRPDRPYLFNSFFLTKLFNSFKQEYKYSEVQRWTARGPGKADLFARRAVFFPINIGNTHWCLAVADMKFKRITYYDSMGGEGQQVLNILMRYFNDEHQDKKKTPLPDADKWQLVSPKRDVPQQNNCNDCGIFTCTFANILMDYFLKYDDKTPPPSIFCFGAKDMPNIRKQIQLDLLREALYPL